MRILIAPDKFKGALSALQVAEAMARGLRRACPQAEIRLHPLADGGEGTAEILAYHNGGTMRQAQVQDPLFRPVVARYGLSHDRQTAYIEMAEASGLALLHPKERNCLLTSTYGTGELILHAWEAGARHIILGIGGSATTDGGIGMAAALGYRLLDAAGAPLSPIGENLGKIAQIDRSALRVDPAALTVEVACDVDNPLCGPRGAAAVYGPQKGADATAVRQLDAGLAHLAQLWARDWGLAVAERPGAGAAGGLGAGAMAFLGARLRPGIDLVMAHSRLDEALAGVDLVLTGEGKIDAQTLHGKVIMGLSRRAAAAGIPLAALCGTLEATPELIEALGLAYAASILNRPLSLEAAMTETAPALEMASFSLLRLFSLREKP